MSEHPPKISHAKASGAGRPRKSENDNNIHESPLYKLFESRLPESVLYPEGGVHVRGLAKALKTHYFTIYRWFNGTPISVPNAKKLLEFSRENGGSLSTDDLRPFTFSL